jgi:cysteine-S-conjugate beta-lyase
LTVDPSTVDPYAGAATQAIHGRRTRDTHADSILFPIYQTATYVHETVGVTKGFSYSRGANPTVDALEQAIASLEETPGAVCFRIGMAAISTLQHGGTCRLFTRVLNRTGITVQYGDASDLESFATRLNDRTRLIYVETPTNPLLRVIDLRKLADLAHARGAVLCVDNSTMSPYLQNPLDLGADIVLHSATKFLCGHSDVTAGVIVVKDAGLGDEIYFLQNAEGSALGPFDSFLLLRGLKTLKLRLDAQEKNAHAVARFLAGHARVKAVYYPGLPDDAGYALQQSQARGAGAVLSFTTDEFSLSKRIAERTEFFRIAVSFGSVNSTISLPGSMSHASVPVELQAARALPSDLVRLSLGIEDADDLIADLGRAFGD